MPQTGRLKDQKCNFLQFYGPEVQDQDASKVGFTLRPLLLTFRWLSSRCIFPFSFCKSREKEGGGEGNGEGGEEEEDGREGEGGGFLVSLLRKSLITS